MDTTALTDLVSFALGTALVWFVMERKMGALRTSLATEQGRTAQLAAELAAARDQFAAERQTLNEQVRSAVNVAAAEAFQTANEQLLKAAGETFGAARAATVENFQGVLSPVAANLAKLEAGITELDKQRLANAQSLTTALQGLTRTGEVLSAAINETKTETARLAGALKDNRIRGKWGEISLERVVEFAGMQEHVDFDRQRSQGQGVPDITIHIPGGVHVPVDAKAPLDAYYEAMASSDPETQRVRLAENAQALRAKIKEVADRGYHKAPGACGFSILYVPLESVLSAALSTDPELLDYALGKQVFLASPLTLIAQLRAFATAWALHTENVNAELIVEQAKKLIDRIFMVGQHLQRTGKALESVVQHWNGAIGSFDSRLTVTALKIAEMTAARELDEDRLPRQIEVFPGAPQRLVELPPGG